MIEVDLKAPAAPPNVRGIVAAMFVAGLVGPRIGPECDLSPLPWLPDDFWERRAYFGEECFKALNDLMDRRGPRLEIPGAIEPRNEAGLILPGAM